MENRIDDLWTGGPWEQPAPVFPSPPAVAIPTRTQTQTRPVLRPHRRHRFHWPVFAALTALVLALCLFAVLLNALTRQNFSFSLPDLPGDSQSTQTQDYSTEPPSIPHAATESGVAMALMPSAKDPMTFTQVYEKNAPSMVSIEAETQAEYSTGTGVILTQDGYIVTNAHVVAGAEHVRVIFSNNNILDASLAGFNADEDLAVLKVDATGLTPAEFGDSSALRCGDPVVAIGDPLGYRSTITDGIVSALDREVDVDGTTMVLIQTSAAINFGNSGGALINQYGQVVGITTIKIVTDDGSAEALGFAIPSQRVKYVVDALIEGRDIQPGVFGFTVLTRPMSGGGLELESIESTSDAYQKGLRAGDILISANGQPITGTQDLARLKLSLGPGDLVTLTYLRDGVSYTVDVALVPADQVS
ncbi:MAG: trypsin-like peptidase domain-containing protein [Lawsonibacter sp.]|nr:trypsin-like peptidase domain-containing protein [Lawsonibacter sp.]